MCSVEPFLAIPSFGRPSRSIVLSFVVSIKKLPGFGTVERRPNNMIIFLSPLACLPSLRPILSFISDKLKLLRLRKSTHKRGSKLLMDMLPVRKQAEPISPISSRQSWNDEPHPMLDSSVFTEIDSNALRAPELDAEAPGPHVLEVETVEPALELESQRQIAELDGRSKCVAEL